MMYGLGSMRARVSVTPIGQPLASRPELARACEHWTGVLEDLLRIHVLIEHPHVPSLDRIAKQLRQEFAWRWNNAPETQRRYELAEAVVTCWERQDGQGEPFARLDVLRGAVQLLEGRNAG